MRIKSLILAALCMVTVGVYAQSNYPFNGLDMNMGNLSRLSDAKTRSISPENFTGEKGKGGMADPVRDKDQRNVANAHHAAKDLGKGWKVNPFIIVKPGETITIAEIEGPGAIQQIWMTPTGNWRFSILRMYWDDEKEPSVECPVGDFFCSAYNEYAQLSSLAVCVNPGSAFNCYWKMPFRKKARITLENINTAEEMRLYYQINYTLTEVPEDEAYFHAQFRRSNPTQGSLHTLIDGVKGKGQYVGTYLAWRVISVADRVGGLLETNILTSLNEPCRIEDTSWIKPCRTTFTWWNGNVVPDSTFSPGNNFDTNKYYIDFAARNGLDAHGIYGYAETPWYYDDNFNFGWAGPNADVTKPIPCLNMPRIVEYARSKGVGIHLWVHWRPLYDKLEEAFALYEGWGVRGLMVDFMDRNDQEMIRIQEEILECAARHRLFIQFHGSSKPSGLVRTYPNEFTREGTLNYEVCKWDTLVNADHDIAIPFTRMLAGATDYHLGGFRALPRSEFKIQYVNPHVMSTRCHMLAMYVVLENHLTSLCDTPKAYEGQPGFEVLRTVPGTWDEIRVPLARMNEHVTVARRSGSDWWVGSLNNGTERDLKLELDFLSEGDYQATIYTDAEDVERNPNNLDRQVRKVTRKDIIELNLAKDGGALLHIRRL